MFSTQTSNPSLSKTGAEIARSVNSEVAAYPKRRLAVVDSIIQQFPAPDFGKFTVENTRILEILAHLYDEENRWISETRLSGEGRRFCFAP